MIHQTQPSKLGTPISRECEENFHHRLHFIKSGVWRKWQSIQEVLRGLERVC